MTDLPAPVAARRGRPGYDQRQILEVAVTTFIEHGYDATSVALLAERLGLSKSAMYHHFTSKEQLLSSALDQALGGLEGVLLEPDAVSGTPGDRLGYVLDRAVQVLVDRLPYVTLLLRVRGNSEVERSALARRRAFDEKVTEIVSAAQLEGSVRADVEASLATRLLFGMVNSIVEWYRPAGAEDPAQLARDVLTVALDGLRTRRS
ncbi:TetR/AcrR family transcriptional regulator [Microbacterium pygmaeum]|uniref:DNA-binding transcriptional regulator, AcrR family n=1 Tax=Microbacterium pygmaeum TaxID=370764 RepID=A0A1G7U1N1_9MICO|nr:TetR/AcrR family transcriptional regulator [Microbacterium pygmaeum]SDG40959.1 DNA-binding transcriptional regulator, AcrR family [Microbacterium pygmaeum]